MMRNLQVSIFKLLQSVVFTAMSHVVSFFPQVSRSQQKGSFNKNQGLKPTHANQCGISIYLKLPQNCTNVDIKYIPCSRIECLGKSGLGIFDLPVSRSQGNTGYPDLIHQKFSFFHQLKNRIGITNTKHVYSIHKQ